MAAPRVLVRSARPPDVARLVELLAAGALTADQEDPGDLAAYRSALDEIQAHPGNDVLGADIDGEVVGVLQLIVFSNT